MDDNQELEVSTIAGVIIGMAFMLSVGGFARTLPDNTAINLRDRESHQITADQQGMNKSDTEITRLIRQAVIAHEEFSVYAHNVKIITTDGYVTLKGPVRTAAEVATIQNIATSFVGKANVKNEMEVVKGE